MDISTTEEGDGRDRREISISVCCDRTSRRCELTIIEGDGGFLDLEDASPREIIERIEELKANPSLSVLLIDASDLHALVREMAKARGLIAHPFEVATERASRDDAAWFRRNPRARLRTRHAFPNEVPGDDFDDCPHVLVIQLRPGVRVRQFGTVREMVH